MTQKPAAVKPARIAFAASFLACWLGSAAFAFGAGAVENITIGFSSFSGFYGPLWIAAEEGLGKKYGIDIKAVYAGRIRPQQLLASGETPFVIASGSGAMTSHVLGVKDQVIVALLSSKLGGGIFARGEIKKPEDLKGKLIATGRPGALNDVLVRYVLTRKWGLAPDRDVKLLPIGEPPLMIQALERGVVDATSLSVPANLVARSQGFLELASYDDLGLAYPMHALTALRPTIEKNPQLVDRVLRAIIEGIAIFKTDKAKALAGWRKYMRGASGEFVEENYQYTRAALETVPSPSPRIIAGALDMLSAHYPQASRTDPNLIVDPSFVRRLEQSGWIQSLYKK